MGTSTYVHGSHHIAEDVNANKRENEILDPATNRRFSFEDIVQSALEGRVHLVLTSGTGIKSHTVTTTSPINQPDHTTSKWPHLPWTHLDGTVLDSSPPTPLLLPPSVAWWAWTKVPNTYTQLINYQASRQYPDTQSTSVRPHQKEYNW